MTITQPATQPTVEALLTEVISLLQIIAALLIGIAAITLAGFIIWLIMLALP